MKNFDKNLKITKIEELTGKIFFTSAACMSVWADALSWANKHKARVVHDPKLSEYIVILSCQVTDLAVLNDFKVLKRYQRQYPGKKYYISGCLARRADINMPAGVDRLELPSEDYEPLKDRSLVNFEPPFWVKNFNSQGSKYEDGHLFRNMYPLRIGRGCPFNCTYCTIRFTRGAFKRMDAYKKMEEEFLRFPDVLLIADSPMPDQIKAWCAIAEKHNKPISIRNIEPQIVMQCQKHLLVLARKKLLKVFHCPIQNNNPDVLRDMGRDVEATLNTIEFAKKLKSLGVFIATNIIIDYKDFPNDFDEIYQIYDYVSWNPLWEGKWDQKKAEKRFEYYEKKF